jgi:hypothetical protein
VHSSEKKEYGITIGSRMDERELERKGHGFKQREEWMKENKLMKDS